MRKTTIVLIVVAVTLAAGAALAEGTRRFNGTMLQIRVDPFTDQRSEFLAVPEDDRVEKTLSFLTTGNELKLAYATGYFIDDDQTTLKYRVNKQPPVTLFGFVSDNMMVVYTGKDATVELLRALVAASEDGVADVAVMIDGDYDSTAILNCIGFAEAVEATILFKAYVAGTD